MSRKAAVFRLLRLTLTEAIRICRLASKPNSSARARTWSMLSSSEESKITTGTGFDCGNCMGNGGFTLRLRGRCGRISYLYRDADSPAKQHALLFLRLVEPSLRGILRVRGERVVSPQPPHHLRE